jgi:hypothetical protein
MLQISASFIIADFINRLSGSRGVRQIGGLLRDSSVRLVRLFEEIHEEILEKCNAAREFNIDVAVIFEDKPWNMGHNALVFRLSPSMLKVSCMNLGYVANLRGTLSLTTLVERGLRFDGLRIAVLAILGPTTSMVHFFGVVYMGHMVFYSIVECASLPRQLGTEKRVDFLGTFGDIFGGHSYVFMRETAFLELGNMDVIQNGTEERSDILHKD